ncbi:MAG: FAD-binding oxidoreductase [Proteobacteria bacterium]|nr:FAD-binding oxidoreductase [Candidatus Puniceispirillum sp.]MDA0801833.1 FAD-binding oxidoreductase [Pseudomonadota bacterium]MDA0884036.1 FAD-binding oxidoreductase [Pseudomonadota bacterium]MDA1150175.1 FAD-binding oxidoreductase [Pseudomonadota bacterium]
MTDLNSIYAAEIADKPKFPAPTGNLDCEIAIIGGGFTGMTAALTLAENGHDVVLVEADVIGSGGSGRNGGHVCQGWSNDFHHISRQLPADEAQLIWDAGMRAVDLLRQRVQRHKIDCNLRFGYLHAALHDRQMQGLLAMRDEWQAKGYDHLTALDNRDSLAGHIGTNAYVGALHDANSGHIQPLKYLYGLARAASATGARIYEHAGVTALATAPDIARHDTNNKGTGTKGISTKALSLANGQKITAKFVLLCGNAYLQNIGTRKMTSRLAPVTSSVLATTPLSDNLISHILPHRAAVADCNTALNYYRIDADGRMIFGGRASYTNVNLGNVEHDLKQRMVDVFPELGESETAAVWSGRIGITVNRIPHFGTAGDGVFFVQGFSGHGVALTGLAGTILANHIMGQSRLFSILSKLRHLPFPGGFLRTPALALGMSWFKMRDYLRL